MKFTIDIDTQEATAEELQAGISEALRSLRLPQGDTLYLADSLSVTVVSEDHGDAEDSGQVSGEIRPGVSAGHFYRWPNEILGLVLNVHDDVARLRELRNPNMRQIEQLAESLENGALPAERYLRTTSPANALGAGLALNADVREILGMPNFQCGPLAHVFQAAGADIKRRSEDEQAFVLHWLLGLYAKHGTGWRAAAAEELDEARATASALISNKALLAGPAQ